MGSARDSEQLWSGGGGAPSPAVAEPAPHWCPSPDLTVLSVKPQAEMKGFPAVIWEDSRSQADGTGRFRQPQATFLLPAWLAGRGTMGGTGGWPGAGVALGAGGGPEAPDTYLVRPRFFFLLPAPFSNSIFSCYIWKLRCNVDKIWASCLLKKKKIFVLILQERRYLLLFHFRNPSHIFQKRFQHITYISEKTSQDIVLTEFSGEKKKKSKVRWAEEPKGWKEKHQYIKSIYTRGIGTFEKSFFPSFSWTIIAFYIFLHRRKINLLKTIC